MVPHQHCQLSTVLGTQVWPLLVFFSISGKTDLHEEQINLAHSEPNDHFLLPSALCGGSWCANLFALLYCFKKQLLYALSQWLLRAVFWIMLNEAMWNDEIVMVKEKEENLRWETKMCSSGHTCIGMAPGPWWPLSSWSTCGWERRSVSGGRQARV